LDFRINVNLQSVLPCLKHQRGLIQLDGEQRLGNLGGFAFASAQASAPRHP
jgi:hypothetical protein